MKKTKWENLQEEALIDRRRDPKLAALLRLVVEGTMADYARHRESERTRGRAAQTVRELRSIEVATTRLNALLKEMATATAMQIGNDVATVRQIESAREILRTVGSKVTQGRISAMKKERRGAPRNVAVRETIEELTLWFEMFTANSPDLDELEEHAEARWRFIKLCFDVSDTEMPTKLRAFVMALSRRALRPLWWHFAIEMERWQDGRELVG